MSASLRVAFAGTPAFAAEALRHIADAGFCVPLVLTQPDRPAGRGMKAQASPVKQLALARGLPVAQPRGLRLDGRFAADALAARAALDAARPDLLVVAAYGLILPAWLLSLPRLGCLNIHGSLLPRWRGAAPVQRAIEAGDDTTGITLMQMDAGMDTGDMLRWQSLRIEADDTSATLSAKLATLGARMVVEALRDMSVAPLPRHAQSADGASYARKIAKSEAPIDWRQPAAVIERRLRAFDPFPGATFGLRGETVKLWRARPIAPFAHRAAAEVVMADAQRLCVACGDGALELLEVQRPGGRRMSVAAFMQTAHGAAITAGTRLDDAH